MDGHKHPSVYPRVSWVLCVCMYLWEQVYVDMDVVGKKTDTCDPFVILFFFKLHLVP